MFHYLTLVLPGKIIEFNNLFNSDSANEQTHLLNMNLFKNTIKTHSYNNTHNNHMIYIQRDLKVQSLSSSRLTDADSLGPVVSAQIRTRSMNS